MKKNHWTSLAEKLRHKYEQIISTSDKKPRCFIGFDGFTDEIIEAVATRTSPDDYISMKTMEQFGRRIMESSGKSCNIELVVRAQKLGGNAPILTNALLEGGHLITFAGAIGTKNHIEPLFLQMGSRCESVYPLCPSGHSDALEFHDGKIILGKHSSLIHLNYRTLLEQIDKATLIKTLNETDLFASANWTMLPMMTELWENLADEIVPHFTIRPADWPRWMFVDLADPAKRTDEDIHKALKALKKLGRGFQVILGLNEAEAIRIGKVLNSDQVGGSPENVGNLAEDILELTGLHQIVIHATKFAVGANATETRVVDGPYTETPLLTTGAGDNFNAGFCNAVLYELTLEDALLSGVYTSGFYVRNERSPTISELAGFLQKGADISGT